MTMTNVDQLPAAIEQLERVLKVARDFEHVLYDRASRHPGGWRRQWVDEAERFVRDQRKKYRPSL